ncbi:MAG TPA: DNA recombination protein RmuC [Thermoanaerobaculia bacterium]|nr:DNA recombination protein RmuC [Thermoanaerobaculia bacterium]
MESLISPLGLLLALAGLLVILAPGLAAGWLLLRTRSGDSRAVLEERLRARDQQLERTEALLVQRERELGERRQEAAALGARVAELEVTVDKERQAAGEKLRLLDEAQSALGDAFKALSSEALKSNNETFLNQVKSTLAVFQDGARGDLELRQQAIGELVKPLRDALVKVEEKIHDVETARAAAYSGLEQHLQGLAASQGNLERETARLVNALRSPGARGRWGEIQLQRVVEMAGMVAYCDFTVQAAAVTEEGRLRPDMVVRLPGGKNLVIDAKAPLDAYLDALDAPDEDTRRARLQAHARQIRGHLGKLAAKAYWSQFEPAPEFVVLFLPGEVFFSAALEQDPSLIELGVDQRVILATPTTLIALLRAIAYGWRQEQAARNAGEIAALGKSLYERLRTFAGHLALLKKGLDQSVEGFNRAVGSLESRVMPQARRFKELGAAGGEELEPLELVDRAPRSLDLPPEGPPEGDLTGDWEEAKAKLIEPV